MSLHVCREVRGESGPLHGGNGKHAGRRHVSGAGAGQRAHVGRADNGNVARAAAEAPEQSEDDRDEIVDDGRLGQQVRRDDKHDDHVQTGVFHRFPDEAPQPSEREFPRSERGGQDDQHDEREQHAFVHRPLEQREADDRYRKHGNQVHKFKWHMIPPMFI